MPTRTMRWDTYHLLSFLLGYACSASISCCYMTSIERGALLTEEISMFFFHCLQYVDRGYCPCQNQWEKENNKMQIRSILGVPCTQSVDWPIFSRMPALVRVVAHIR
eukprot:scaffold22586_cov138-Cylindrotheca_fusiformis.AAC.19